QRGRDAEAPGQNTVQERVLGVVVVAGVPPEAELPEQAVEQAAQVLDALGPAVDLGQPWRRFGAGITCGADQQRHLRKIELRLRSGRQRREPGERIHAWPRSLAPCGRSPPPPGYGRHALATRPPAVV